MDLSDHFLKALAGLTDRAVRLQLVWPVAGNPAGLVTFDDFGQWYGFISDLGLRRTAPDIVRLKFDRAQKLYLLAWLDFDLIKAGELTALTALELALTDRYGDKVRDKKGRIYFYRLLHYMPKGDGFTDSQLPMIRKSGGTAVPFLTGEAKPSLSEIRNKLAHGYPFDGFATGGLLELVRDLIDYAYRDWPPKDQMGA